MQGKIEAALQESDLPPHFSATLVELQERVGQLRSIIDSLLLLSRSDAGSLVPDRGELSLAELLVDVLEDAEILADEAGLTIQTDVGVPGAKVSGDGRLLRLAISNLLTNAVKYNVGVGGEVYCDLKIVEGGYAVVVRNTGPPISGVEKDKIFERFYRADPARGASKPGFGLGLSLSQVIVRAHGGNLTFEGSRAGVNTFVIRLPPATQKLSDSVAGGERE
jgi:signal transduction histidine kinase